jgi:hypothetical protein
MHRQLKLFALAFLTMFILPSFFPPLAQAKPPTDSVYTVPSEKTEEKPTESQSPVITPEKVNLDGTNEAHELPKETIYHLPPGQSFTLAFSPVLDLKEKDESKWFGLYYVPWMDATSRVQGGVNINGDTGWFEVAYHELMSRNVRRFYWGGGASLVVDTNDKMAPLTKLSSYNLFVLGGWEIQVTEMQSFRFETSYHRGTELQFLKLTLGLTFHF